MAKLEEDLSSGFTEERPVEPMELLNMIAEKDQKTKMLRE